jgi:hypothetical protein
MINEWLSQKIEIEVEIFKTLSQFSDEAIIDYLESLGYKVQEKETE